MKAHKILNLLFVFLLLISVNSSTSFAANNEKQPINEVTEGYIIIGESHVVLSSNNFIGITNPNTYEVTGLDNVYYNINVPNIFSTEIFDSTAGNLFFACEGLEPAIDDDHSSISEKYIYSDGINHGLGVERIHTIINSHPYITHWNIISFQGAIAATKGSKLAKYYIDSYKNWIKYEFPDATILILSHSTMTKFYRSCKNSDALDKALAKAFPDRFIDYTDYYNASYPQKMLDPNVKSDTIHWNSEVYIYVISNSIRKCQEINNSAIKK